MKKEDSFVLVLSAVVMLAATMAHALAAFTISLARRIKAGRRPADPRAGTRPRRAPGVRSARRPRPGADRPLLILEETRPRRGWPTCETWNAPKEKSNLCRAIACGRSAASMNTPERRQMLGGRAPSGLSAGQHSHTLQNTHLAWAGCQPLTPPYSAHIARHPSRGLTRRRPARRRSGGRRIPRAW